MHCRSCEMMVEEEILKIPGIKKVKVSAKKGTAEIFYNKDVPGEDSLNKAVQAAGYQLGRTEFKFFSDRLVDYTDLVTSASILVILYLIAESTGLTKLSIITGNDYGNLFTVALIGLTAGFSSCMALIGGLVLAIASRHAEKHPGASALAEFRPHLFFNLGRLASFTLLGGIIGQAGSALKLSTTALGWMTVVAGIFMIFLGLQLIQIFPFISKFSLSLPKKLSKLLNLGNRREQEYSHKNAMVMGALTFFLPCGFTQAMQLYAVSSGSLLTGALTMGVFALGTAPGLLGIGGLTALMKGKFAEKFFKFTGVIVVILALVNLNSGLNLAGVNLPSLPASSDNQPAQDATVESGTQILRMEQSSRGYSPKNFTIKKGVPVKWIIKSLDNYSCASSIVVPTLNISRTLSPGENIIEFTAQKAGIIKFSCSMGMYAGTINVI